MNKPPIKNFRRAAFSSQLKSQVGHILAKAAALHSNLNIDGTPITSRSHTHPSHTQNSHPSTSSLSLGVTGPRSTQCIRDTQIHQFYLFIFHYTDTHLYLFSLTLTLPVHKNTF